MLLKIFHCPILAVSLVIFPYKSGAFDTDLTIKTLWKNPTGEKSKDALRVDFDKELKLEFHGTKVTCAIRFLCV